MLEERGIVTEVTGKFAYVETALKSSCSHCSASSCGTGALASHFSKRSTRIKVENSHNAQKGDSVVIGIDESSMMNASLLVYMLPLLLLFVGGYLGELGTNHSTIGEWSSIIGGVFGLVIGLFWARRIGQSSMHDSKLQAVMIRCDHAPIQTISFNRTTPTQQ